MIFRQLFDYETYTYSYLIAARKGGEALIIDPVKNQVSQYLKLMQELDVKLVFAIDTHVHADHITGLGDLREATECVTILGQETKAACVSRRISEGEKITVDSETLTAIYTPGHTDDSYSFVMRDRVFTGDTLLIRSTGRTDFQNGDPKQQYDSLFNKLLKLPDELMVYPAHDYKGWMMSTIGEEKRWNPRLQLGSETAYIEMMKNLKLDNPKWMDVAVPANLNCGGVVK